MPVYTPYPGPGKGISPAGINKTSGFKADIIAQSGINKQAGKSLSGLDTAANPIVTSFGLTGVAATTATVTWTTQIGAPLGSITYRKADGSAAAVTVAETGSPPTVSHSIPLTGLVAATYYTYEVTQPGAAGTGGKTIFSGRFGTTGTATPTEGEGMTQQQQQPAPSNPTSSPPGVEPNAFDLTLLQVVGITDVEATVQWRTEVYADGTVSYRESNGVVGPDVVVEEGGAKRLNHSVILSGLEPGKVYRVAVVSADATGALAHGGPITFSTEPAA